MDLLKYNKVHHLHTDRSIVYFLIRLLLHTYTCSVEGKKKPFFDHLYIVGTLCTLSAGYKMTYILSPNGYLGQWQNHKF